MMDRFLQRCRTSTPPRSREALLPVASISNKIVVEPANKKRKRENQDTDDDDDGDDVDSSASSSRSPRKSVRRRDGCVDELVMDEEDLPAPHRQTAIESTLPPVKTGKEAIEEYGTGTWRASQRSEGLQVGKEDAVSRLEKRNWVQGRSSIYVDAFNLALDTVLEDEADLFDDKERKVFEEWRGLRYEAQYLYVRLFLRKTASWHRVGRLGYHGDMGDVGGAIADLLQSRQVPIACVESNESNESKESARRDMQEWWLPDSFTFADASESHMATVDVAAPLLSVEELKRLAKEARVQGRKKADLVGALCRISKQQAGLFAMGVRRDTARTGHFRADASAGQQGGNRESHFLAKMMAMTGPLIRLSEPVFRLFERVHLVFYRSTEWTERSLTTIILAKISRRSFPEYVVCRCNMFATRSCLVEFEYSMRKQFEVDQVLELGGRVGEDGFRRVLSTFESISSRWRELLREEQDRQEDGVCESGKWGEGAYLRRFRAAHAYTRIAHKAAHVLGRLHEHVAEHGLLTELLNQRLFHPARRGAWYQRKALLEERYMWAREHGGEDGADVEMCKTRWSRLALATCEAGLQDRDCHLIHHHDLQKRLVRLERRVGVPRRLRHHFGHVQLAKPEEHTVYGIQLVQTDAGATSRTGSGRGPNTKTVWLDTLGDVEADGTGRRVGVEAMCLSHYRSQGWKGYHAEGGILRTLFAYLFYDLLFLPVPDVFQTAFQTCPLDLHTDAFYATRASEINHRLVAIANGAAEAILADVDARERPRRTCVVGLNWDYDSDDLRELVRCFRGDALAAVCKVMAQEYGARGGGVPDLLLWRTVGESGESGEVLFAEVKTANDRLSDAQRLWIHVLTGTGVRVALCSAVAREVRNA